MEVYQDTLFLVQMGCSCIELSLVQGWKFIHVNPAAWKLVQGGSLFS